MYVYLCIYVLMCVWLHVATFQIRSCDPNSVTGDSNLCPLYTRYTGDSKTDPHGNPEICIGSCSDDQTTIRFRNCVISCECLFLYHFLIYFRLWILCFYSYYSMWPLDILYQYDFLCYFM